MDRGNKSVLIIELEVLPSWGPTKDQGEVGRGNSPKGASDKQKKGRSGTKHKKVKRSYKNKHSKSWRS